MTTTTKTTYTQSILITDHIETLLQHHQDGQQESNSAPLVIGLQGPQGSGKTTVTRQVCARLKASGKRVASLSIDDLYLTHAQMIALEEANPTNVLLQGRGLPGTHDIELGREILMQLKRGSAHEEVHIPVYDKSLFSGQGDRSSNDASTTVHLPVDVVIFEGWCLGFYPIGTQELTDKYMEQNAEYKRAGSQPFFVNVALDSLLHVNRLLQHYVDQWYKFIDGFVQLCPTDLMFVFDWRLEAEHVMQAKGKPTMNDDEVKAFITRYMPAYELFLDGIHRTDAPWHSKGLRIVLNGERGVEQCSQFWYSFLRYP